MDADRERRRSVSRVSRDREGQFLRKIAALRCERQGEEPEASFRRA